MISYDGLQTQADWLLFVENTNIKLMCIYIYVYMSGYVGSMPNKVLIQTATLYHWIQNPLTEPGLVFHEEKNLFQWVNLWNQGKFHLTFLTRSSRIWDCEAYTAETKNQPQDWDVCFANWKII